MMRLLLLLFLLPWAALAQELPPPGGWPLRPVTELRAVPEPPGGLVPYRQGALWGFADTTGRVWIRPVFAQEPPRFGAGLMLLSEQSKLKEYRPRRVFRRVGAGSFRPRRKAKADRSREPRDKSITLSSNVRYGRWLPATDGVLSWALSTDKPRKLGRTWLLNAHGEQLEVGPNEAIVTTADGSWRAATRRRPSATQRELVAIAPHELESEAVRPGQLFTVLLGQQAPAPPPRLMRRRAYDPVVDFTASFAGSTPMYLAQKVNWLRPTRQVLRNGRCGDRFEDTDTRYRHQGQFALLDARGHRLTHYRYAGMKRLLPRRLAYWHWADSTYYDEAAAEASGLPKRWRIVENINGPARRYGLLDQRGREITPPLYARMETVGPNSLWVVAVKDGRLHYGLMDTLGRYLRPLRPEPISLPDAAGLLRHRSAAPQKAVENPRTYQREPHCPDTATVHYLRANGQVAFAGHFAKAGPFWQGRALVKVGAAYGIIDSVGHWALPLQPDELRYYAFSARHPNDDEGMDPLELFDAFTGAYRQGPYRGTLFDSPQALLLTHGPAGYGFCDGRTGQTLAPALFDEAPTQWPGGVVGKRQNNPAGISYTGKPFNPDTPASYPLGVRKPVPADAAYRPLLQRTDQGWRTRGGRQLWQE